MRNCILALSCLLHTDMFNALVMTCRTKKPAEIRFLFEQNSTTFEKYLQNFSHPLDFYILSQVNIYILHLNHSKDEDSTQNV